MLSALRRAGLTLAGLLLVTGCGDNTTEIATKKDSGHKTQRVSGIDRSGMDTSIRPQDDFFAYANGAWLANTEIPADKSSWGSFHILHEKSLKQLQAIIQASAKTADNNESATKIGAFYRAWLDHEAVEERGISPLQGELDTIQAATTADDIVEIFGHYNSIGIDAPFNFWINQDDKDSTRYVVFLTQSGLGLPDRDYYFDESERGQEILDRYREFITALLQEAGAGDAETAAERIIELETRLAEHQWTKVENRDSEKTYNKYTAAETRALLADFDFHNFAKGAGIAGQVDYVVRQLSYFEALNQIFREADIDTWRDYLTFNLLASYAPYLSEPFEQLHFGFYNQTLNGQPEQEARWKRAINSINSNIGELLGQLYVAKHFPPEAKARMTELVDNLIAAYRESIINLEWMSDATREKALDKLGKFTPKIGYPDKWKDYSTLEVRDDDLVGNIKRARQFNHQLQVDKLGKPVDRDEWFMTPQRVNAYYNPGMNEIVFPAAILQPPFFNLEADDAVNYGAIGGVIGHEIGHGFDDQGSKYTGDGNLENWWTSADRKRFDARTRQLISQYRNFEPLPGLRLNGALTLGENIGDLGGLSIAHKAYLLSLKGEPAPELDGFTGDQRVFIGWAQGWRVKRRQELVERLVKTDPHSPPEFRVNGVVANITPFYDAFGVGPGDKLYLPPEQRVRIW